MTNPTPPISPDTELAGLRRCSACNHEKPVAAFYARKDGRMNFLCRQCRDARNSIYRLTPKSKELQRLNRINGTISDLVKATRLRKAKLAAQRFPEQQYAKRKVRTAISNGSLVRPPTCQQCGGGRPLRDGRAFIHAHHEDYSRPLDVIWLCPPCHTAIHRAKKGNSNGK